MTFIDSIITPPPYFTNSQGDSDAVLICSIFFKNKKYAVEGRKFGQESICWEVEELGFLITSNNNTIVFSNNELNTPEINQIFTMWHEAGIDLFN